MKVLFFFSFTLEGYIYLFLKKFKRKCKKNRGRKGKKMKNIFKIELSDSSL